MDQIISHYRILELVGSGGMGVVYTAEDIRLGRHVALKFLPEGVSQDREALERFLLEARATAALDHPHICTIYGIDEDRGRPFIVMELLKGRTLKSCIAEGPLALEELLGMGTQIVDALAATHAKGIVHRDIKPGNIFLTQQRGAKILDFGIAKLLRRESNSLTTASNASPRACLSLTLPGVPVGTLAYMSPEQARGEEVDGRSDLFSVGVVLYEAATGRTAFPGNNAAMIFDAILNRAPAGLTELNPKIPLELGRIITKALEKDRSVRYQTASDLLVDLERLGQDSASGRLVAAKSRRITGRPKALTRSRPYESARIVRSVAVLPLVNVCDNPETEYLSDGITESIINSLSPLRKLRVMAWSTVVRFKGRETDARAIGRQLNVDAVLTGKVLRQGDELMIGTELVDVATGAQLWGGRYNRKLQDVFEVQEAIATEISSKLRLRLSGEEKKRLFRRYTRNLEAYQLYLKGRHFWNQRGTGLIKAIPLFEQALEKDSEYALAYAGVADCYSQLGFWGRFPPQQVFPKAKATLQKALEIDEALPEAYATLGFVLQFFDRDKIGAARAFERAIALNPDYPSAHMWYSAYFFMMGQPEKAIEEDRRALVADSLSFAINAHFGWVLVSARRIREALGQLQTALELNPDFFVTHWLFGQAYLLLAKPTEAIASYTRAVGLSQRNPRMVGWLGYALSVSGHHEEALALENELIKRSEQEYIPPTSFAYLYMGLGQKKKAFECLETAYIQRDVWLPYIYVDSAFDTVRTDPQFQDLLRRLDLPFEEKPPAALEAVS
jgi:serine/threonine protein kinase/tetratricopeptide (TPR) repeat protein